MKMKRITLDIWSAVKRQKLNEGGLASDKITEITMGNKQSWNYIITFIMILLLTIGGCSSVRETVALSGHTKEVSQLAYTPDGRYLISASSDKIIRLWDTQDFNQVYDLCSHYSSSPISIAISPDGRYLASTSPRTRMIDIWDLETRDIVKTFNFNKRVHVSTICYSPDGKRMAAAAGGNIVVFDVLSEQIIKEFKVSELSLTSLAYMLDGTVLIAGDMKNNMTLWNTENYSLVRSVSIGRGSHMVLSPDGSSVAIDTNLDGTFGKSIKLLNVNKMHEIWRVDTEPWVMRWIFSPDCRVVATSGDKAIELWDYKTGKKLLTIANKYERSGALAFSPDSRFLATESSQEEAIKIWDITSPMQKTNQTKYAPKLDDSEIQKIMQDYLTKTYHREFFVGKIIERSGISMAECHLKEDDFHWFVLQWVRSTNKFYDNYLQIQEPRNEAIGVESYLKEIYGADVCIKENRGIAVHPGNTSFTLECFVFIDSFNDQFEARRAYDLYKKCIFNLGIYNFNVDIYYLSNDIKEEFNKFFRENKADYRIYEKIWDFDKKNRVLNRLKVSSDEATLLNELTIMHFFEY